MFIISIESIWLVGIDCMLLLLFLADGSRKVLEGLITSYELLSVLEGASVSEVLSVNKVWSEAEVLFANEV